MIPRILFFFIVVFLSLFPWHGWSQTSFAILPMDVRNEIKTEKVEGVMNRLNEVLVNSKKYRIVDRDHVKNILSEQNFQISGVTDKKDAVKLGKILNVEKLIATSIYTKGDQQLAINLRVIDVSTGQAEVSKEISRLNYSPADHGRFCATEIISQYPLLGKIDAIIKDIVIVSIGGNQGLKTGNRLFVARKEVLRDDSGAILFQEYKRIGTLEILSVDDQRSKTRFKDIANSNQPFAKGDLVSPEPIPKKELLISQVPLLNHIEKGNLILEDDMESAKYLSVSNGLGEAYAGGKLHLNATARKAGHAYSFYPQPYDKLRNIIAEGEIEFKDIKNKYNRVSVVIRSNNEYIMNNSYNFFINNDGKYEVYLSLNGTRSESILPFQTSPYLNRGSATNTFRIVAYESRFDFYLNDHFIGGFEHEMLPEGTIGFMAYWGGYAAIDNIRIWEAVRK